MKIKDLNCQKNEILYHYKTHGNFTKVAKEFNCNRVTITKFIKLKLGDWEKFRTTKIDRPWTKEEVKTLYGYPEMSFLEISKQLDRKYVTVREKARLVGAAYKDRSLAAKESAKRNGQTIWCKEKILKDIAKCYGLLSSHYDAILKYPKLYDAASRYFGSWKNAVILAKCDYYVLYKQATSFMGIDDNIYDSRSECIIGNFIYIFKECGYIPAYTPHKRVCDTRHWLCDFYIEFFDNRPLWLEFDGLQGKRRNKNRYKEKLDYYEKGGYNYISLKSVNKTIKYILSLLGRENEYCFWISNKEIYQSTLNIKYNQYKQDVIDDVIHVYKQNGEVPSSPTYRKYGKYNRFRPHFETWREVLEAANLWEIYPKKRLDKKQVREIKRRLTQEDCESIAKDMNISFRAVKYIYYGYRWKDVSIKEGM